MPWNELIPRVSCILTDGENANPGQHNSLWASLDKERSEQNAPRLLLLKIWCGVHRSDLAFASESIQDNHLTLLQLSKKVEDVEKSIKDLHDNPLLGGWESIPAVAILQVMENL